MNQYGNLEKVSVPILWMLITTFIIPEDYTEL